MNNTLLVLSSVLIDSNLDKIKKFPLENIEFMIAQMEIILEVQLPQVYKEFLYHYNGLNCDGFELYHLTKQLNDDGIPNIIWVTQTERIDGLPNNYLVLADGGLGDWYVMDCFSKLGRVDLYDYLGNVEEAYISFDEFVFHKISKLIQE